MSKNSKESNRRKGIFFALLTTFVFGIVGIIDKLGTVATKTPFLYSTQSVFFAFCFTALCYFFLYRKTVKKEITSTTIYSWIQIIIIGCFASGLFLLLRFIGLTQSTGTFASLSQAVTTSLTVILAHFFLKERLSKISWLLFFLVLIAMYFVSVGNFTIASINKGDFYILLGTLFLGTSNIISRMAVKKNNPFFVSTGRFFFGFIFLLLINLLFSFHSSIFSFSFFSLLSGLFWAANVIFFNLALKRIGASLTTSIIMIGPIITMLLEATLLTYHFTLLQYLAACIVVLSGIAIALTNWE